MLCLTRLNMAVFLWQVVVCSLPSAKAEITSLLSWSSILYNVCNTHVTIA